MSDTRVIIVERVEGVAGADAVAVRGERIVWAGPRAAAPAGARIELPDTVALPGLVDGHTHPAWVGESLDQLDLAGSTTADAVCAAVARAPGRGWLRGHGWDDDRWPAGPDRRLDAAAPDRPVLLHRHDRHAAWANGAALAAAGIDETTADPPGGRIARDTDGRLTGLLFDNAIRRVLDAIPPPTTAQRRRWLTVAARRFSAAGLTAVHDVCASVADLAAWSDLDPSTAPVRVHALVDAEDAELEAVLQRGPMRDPWRAVGGVKFFADGALGSRSALLGAPYADAPHTCGLAVVTADDLIERARGYAERGFQVGVHAIGDAAARAAVKALAAAPPVRHRVEHAQIVDPATIAALGEAGLVAGIQPTHAVADAPWIAERLGPERLSWAYAWRSLAAAGARLVIGSDCPIEAADPLAALRVAVKPPEGIGEALDYDAALRASTATAAWAAFAEHDRGRIAPGMLADLTFVSPDPRPAIAAGAPVAVRGTMVGGRWSYGPV